MPVAVKLKIPVHLGRVEHTAWRWAIRPGINVADEDFTGIQIDEVAIQLET